MRGLLSIGKAVTQPSIFGVKPKENPNKLLRYLSAKYTINVTILILILSIVHFCMVVFLLLHPIEFIFLKSFTVLEDHVANSTLAINC